MAYSGGLSMGLDDINIPDNKDGLIEEAKQEVDAVMAKLLDGSDHR